MAIIKGILGSSIKSHKAEKQIAQRIKSGISKLSESIAEDLKQSATESPALPKDWRSRVLK